MIKSISNNKQAFTLIELMVSIIVFSFFIGMMISSYLNLSTSLREANENRKVYIEAREILNQLTQDIKQGTIDYDYYGWASFQTESQKESPCQRSNVNGTLPLPVDQGVDNELDNGTTVLALLIDNGHKRILYRQKDTDIQILKQICSEKNWLPDQEAGFTSSDENGWKPIVGENIKISKLNFLIRPTKDPLVLSQSTYDISETYQPQVTILLSVERAHKTFDVQTTVVSRVY